MPGVPLTAARAQATTLPDMLLAAIGRHDGPALRFKRDSAWRELSYAELGAAIAEIAAGLASIGIGAGDRVAVLSDTRPEWTLADWGATCAGAIVVPVYQTCSPEECAYILAHSGARAVFCENAGQLAKVERVRASCPGLEHVIAFEQAAGDALSLEDLRARGDAPAVESGAAPDDPATIVYTSGTTGPPKGCVLTHANLLAAVSMLGERLEVGPEGLRVFIFLPLAHALARITQLVVLERGGTLAYWERDPRLILDNLLETRPTHFPSVPRVFEKVHARAIGAVEGAGGPRRALFHWALRVGRETRERERRGERPGLALRARHRLADRLVLSRVRRLFGDELRQALTGAAPIAPEVLEFFDACGVQVLEGYGMTETCAAATLNTPTELRYGTVGRALPGVEIEIAPDGEVLMRGPNVFAGYYREDAATQEALEDGWLHSGDLGALDPDGFLRITGRKKDLIITSSGKNITPTNIESALRESRWISQAVVYGDDRPYLVAILTLDPEELPALAERLGIEPDPAAMAHDDRVRAELASAVEQANRRFARIEQVKRFTILDHDLTLAAGELTPTLKVKRAIVFERYRDTFDALYG